jgi:hypothetical protein
MSFVKHPLINGRNGWASLILLGVGWFAGCSQPAGGDTYNAWYRPVPLGWCPRYIVGDRHAWLVGKIAPSGERPDVRRTVFNFRGRFLTTDAGAELVRTSCDNRPYPVFELFEVVGERPMTEVDNEPIVGRGPGAPDAGPPAAPAAAAAAAADGGWKDPGQDPGVTPVIVPREAKSSGRGYRRGKAKRKQRSKQRNRRRRRRGADRP